MRWAPPGRSLPQASRIGRGPWTLRRGSHDGVPQAARGGRDATGRRAVRAAASAWRPAAHAGNRSRVHRRIGAVRLGCGQRARRPGSTAHNSRPRTPWLLHVRLDRGRHRRQQLGQPVQRPGRDGRPQLAGAGEPDVSRHRAQGRDRRLRLGLGRAGRSVDGHRLRVHDCPRTRRPPLPRIRDRERRLLGLLQGLRSRDAAALRRRGLQRHQHPPRALLLHHGLRDGSGDFQLFLHARLFDDVSAVHADRGHRLMEARRHAHGVCRYPRRLEQLQRPDADAGTVGNRQSVLSWRRQHGGFHRWRDLQERGR